MNEIRIEQSVRTRIMGNVRNVACITGAAEMTTVTAKTKLDARAETATETTVTIDWSRVSEDDIKALATRTIVIAAQSQWRKEGVIPETATLDAYEYAHPTRKPRGPVDVAALLKKMSPEERAAILASLG